VRGDRGASFAKFYAAVKKNPKAVEAIGKLDCRWGAKHTAALKIIAAGGERTKVSKALSLDQLKDKTGVSYNDVKRAYDGATNDNDKRAIKAWAADQLGAHVAARLASGGGTKQTTHMPLAKAVRHVKYWRNAVGKKGGGPGNSRLRKLQAAVKVLKGVPGGEEQYNKLFK
tara:strand:- start:4836 stop:5348 length:513 start_codon:yes stop_codon:yes gene_type:complete